MKKEIFKPVKNYELRFKIGNKGSLISVNGKYKGEKLLNIHIDSLGYHFTTLRDGKNKYRQVRVHQLVAETFLVKPSIPHVCVNHLDGNKLNNSVENLEWTDKKNNCLHATSTGLHDIKGSKHHNSKLTEKDIPIIRELSKFHSTKSIGETYNVHRRTIADIINKKTWNHV